MLTPCLLSSSWRQSRALTMSASGSGRTGGRGAAPPRGGSSRSRLYAELDAAIDREDYAAAKLLKERIDEFQSSGSGFKGVTGIELAIKHAKNIKESKMDDEVKPIKHKKRSSGADASKSSRHRSRD